MMKANVAQPLKGTPKARTNKCCSQVPALNPGEVCGGATVSNSWERQYAFRQSLESQILWLSNPVAEASLVNSESCMSKKRGSTTKSPYWLLVVEPKALLLGTKSFNLS